MKYLKVLVAVATCLSTQVSASLVRQIPAGMVAVQRNSDQKPGTQLPTGQSQWDKQQDSNLKPQADHSARPTNMTANRVTPHGVENTETKQQYSHAQVRRQRPSSKSSKSCTGVSSSDMSPDSSSSALTTKSESSSTKTERVKGLRTNRGTITVTGRKISPERVLDVCRRLKMEPLDVTTSNVNDIRRLLLGNKVEEAFAASYNGDSYRDNGVIVEKDGRVVAYDQTRIHVLCRRRTHKPETTSSSMSRLCSTDSSSLSSFTTKGTSSKCTSSGTSSKSKISKSSSKGRVSSSSTRCPAKSVSSSSSTSVCTPEVSSSEESSLPSINPLPSTPKVPKVSANRKRRVPIRCPASNRRRKIVVVQEPYASSSSSSSIDLPACPASHPVPLPAPVCDDVNVVYRIFEIGCVPHKRCAAVRAVGRFPSVLADNTSVSAVERGDGSRLLSDSFGDSHRCHHKHHKHHHKHHKHHKHHHKHHDILEFSDSSYRTHSSHSHSHNHHSDSSSSHHHHHHHGHRHGHGHEHEGHEYEGHGHARRHGHGHRRGHRHGHRHNHHKP